jgi:hypothetical protein
MRRPFVLCLVGLVLAACGPVAEVPTPLPTAVPPDAIPAGEEGLWAIDFRYEFPKGTFGLGPHRYRFWIHCPVTSSDDTITDWLLFEISDVVLPQKEPIYLRLLGLSNEPFAPSYNANNVFDPERPVIAAVYLVGLSYQAASLAASGCEALVLWDEVGRRALPAGEPFQP